MSFDVEILCVITSATEPTFGPFEYTIGDTTLTTPNFNFVLDCYDESHSYDFTVAQLPSNTDVSSTQTFAFHWASTLTDYFDFFYNTDTSIVGSYYFTVSLVSQKALTTTLDFTVEILDPCESATVSMTLPSTSLVTTSPATATLTPTISDSVSDSLGANFCGNYQVDPVGDIPTQLTVSPSGFTLTPQSATDWLDLTTVQWRVSLTSYPASTFTSVTEPIVQFDIEIIC